MSDVVEVKLWGTTIGHIGYSPGQKSVATFEYDDTFVRSGIHVSPIKMPCPPALHSFDEISQMTFRGLPGIFADSLPDKFGNQLIDLYMAEKNIPPGDITALDRLLYIGIRGMGALEYQPAEQFANDKESNTALDIHMLAELADTVMSKQKEKQQELLKTETRSTALKLIRIGSSAGGARSKALVARSPEGRLYDGTVDQGNGYTYWLLKFDSDSNVDRDSSDPKGMPKVEFIYSKIAAKCGIVMPKTEFLEDGDDFHFLIKRFDRIAGSTKTEKLHYGSWAGLAHADRNTSGAYSYEQLILFSRELGLGQDSITELFRRAVFNVIGRNQDDHTKNFGFLMNKAGEWRLSPAFDMTYSFDPTGKWTKVHQIALNRKQDNFARHDLVEFGHYCNLDDRKANIIISAVIEAFSSFPKYASEYDLNPELSRTIQENLRIHSPLL